MSDASPTTGPASLVPPYPNLGPEPMAEPWSAPGWLIASGWFIVLFLGLVILRGVAGRRRKPVSPPPARTVPVGAGSPRERLVVVSAEVRSALVARFGDEWRAKTTEEVESALVADDSAGEVRHSLVELLRLADLAKFGGERFDAALADRVAHCGELDPDDWCAAVVRGLNAGARSTISGR